MLSVPVTPLTEGAFARYGRVIERPRAAATASRGGWRWWEEIALLAAGPRPYALGYLELSPAPLAFDWAERHRHSQELIVPLTGACLVYVAPAAVSAAAEALRKSFQVFRVSAGQAVLLDKGVWHGAPLALDEEMKALVVLLEGTGSSDTEAARFAEVMVVGPDGRRSKR